jgi:hypothetical protein
MTTATAPNQKLLLLTLSLAVLGMLTMGCTIAATPATVSVAPAPVQTTVVHQTVAPARVYHNGSWLYYRTDGYYYSSHGRWVAARSVPTHVTTYHRPGRPTHVVTHQSRPTHVVRTAPSRPTHVVRTAPSRTTHVQRTVSPRSSSVRSTSPSRVQRTTTHRSTTTRRTYNR